MNKKLVIIIVAILVLMIFSFAYFYSPFLSLYFKYSFNNIYADWHNKRIDYSCNVDEDCVVESTGCNCCGYTFACVNKNSVSGLCPIPIGSMTCKCVNPIPTSCVCVNAGCQSKNITY